LGRRRGSFRFSFSPTGRRESAHAPIRSRPAAPKGFPMAKTKLAERPLSPHLQVYKWPITMASSIFHRFTGIGNTLGLLLVTYWVIAIAMGPQAYGDMQALMQSWIGQILLFGFTWSVTYHALNGIRHLMWDTGRGLALKTAHMTAWAAFILSTVITAGLWVAGYALQGGL
jgi:succinate dehydrogenase / fumarate reductase cytochrome b subunit